MAIIVKKTSELTFHQLFNGVSEPAYFINSFITLSLNRFGVVSFPQALIDSKIWKSIEDKKWVPIEKIGEFFPSEGEKILYTNLMAAPLYDNVAAIINKGINTLNRGEDLFMSEGMFVYFYEHLFRNNMPLPETEVIINDFESAYDSYVSLKNPSVSVLALERLIKLFAIFYGKKEIKALGAEKDITKVQLHLLNIARGNKSYLRTLNLQPLIDTVLAVRGKYEEKFSSNNIFNKILELATAIDRYQKAKAIKWIEDNGIVILSPASDFIEKEKEEIKRFLESC
jgi:hypothetical protein